jgi:hypothetical protein
MEWACVDLYLSLQPKNPFESMLADLFVRTHKAGWDCHEQADWRRHHPDVREINLKYALKLTESSARLSARLESYRAKQIAQMPHNSVTADRNSKVLSGQLARASKKQDKARVKLNGNGKHPYTTHNSHAQQPSLWRADSLRPVLPVPCRDWQKKVPHAWRSQGLRRAAG